MSKAFYNKLNLKRKREKWAHCYNPGAMGLGVGLLIPTLCFWPLKPSFGKLRPFFSHYVQINNVLSHWVLHYRCAWLFLYLKINRSFWVFLKKRQNWWCFILLESFVEQSIFIYIYIWIIFLPHWELLKIHITFSVTWKKISFVNSQRFSGSCASS